MAALKEGNADRVRGLLIEAPSLLAEPVETGETITLCATYYGNAGLARELVGLGAPYSIFEASALGDVDAVREFVQLKPTLVGAWSSDGWQPLHLGSYFGHLGVSDYLLIAGADPNVLSRNPIGVMPLHAAVAGRHADVAKLLLDNEAQVNAKSDGGWTPLHNAANNGDAEMVRLLISWKASVDARNDSGKTPIDCAMEHGHTAIADVLRGLSKYTG